MVVLRSSLVRLLPLLCLLPFPAAAQPGQYGTIATDFGVTPSGEAQYSLAIETPEGPGGVRPSLSLEYRHRAGDGVLGMGWRLGGLSAITRCPRTVAQDGAVREVRYDTGDRFCLDGQRLVLIAGTYGAASSEYRTELETFKKIVAHGQVGNGPAYFVVKDRDGREYQYGNYYNSSLVDSATGSNRQWALYQIGDRHNNLIQISYTKDDALGELLVNDIQYTRNDSQGLASKYRVALVYQDKPVAHRRTLYHAGAPLTLRKRIASIRVERGISGWQPIRIYNLAYLPEAASPHHSLLEYVQECSSDPGLCINGSTFEWADGQIGAGGFDYAIAWGGSPSDYHVVGDFNGDGREDMASRYFVDDGSEHTEWGMAFSYGQVDGTFSAPDYQQWGIYCAESRVMEFNGDGRADLLCLHNWGGTGYGGQMHLFQSTATGWVWTGDWGHVIWDTNRHGWLLLTGDVNGDSLTDYQTWNATTGWLTYLNTGSWYASGVGVGADAGDPDNALTLGVWVNMDDDLAAELVVPRLEVGGAYQGLRVYQHNASTGQLDRVAELLGLNIETAAVGIPNALKPLPDINGDGLPDLVYENDQGSFIYTRLNNGKGFGAETTSGVADGGLSYGRYVDANHDGRDDLLAWTGSNQWALHVSNGSTFVAQTSGLWSGITNFYLADVTGDGHRDPVYRTTSGAWQVSKSLAEQETVTTFWDGLGNWQKVTYRSLPQLTYFYNDLTPSLPATRMFRGPLYVVDQHEGNTSTDVTGYSYATGVQSDTFVVQYRYWNAMLDNLGRGFLGFNWFRTVDSRHGRYSDQIFLQTFPLTGQLDYALQRQLAGDTIIAHRDAAAPVVTSLGAGRYFVHVDQDNTWEYEVGVPANGQHIRTISRTRTFDTTSGAVDLETTSISSFSGETYTTTVDPTLINYTGPWCLGLPDAVAVTRSGFGMTQKTRTVDHVFDPNTCRLTSSTNTSEGAAAMQLKTTFTFDGVGNTKTITLNDAANTALQERKTELFYNTAGHLNHLPSSMSRYIAGEPTQTESFTWDYNLILPLTHTAVGSLTTTNTYDLLGRLSRETRSDGSYTDFTRSMDYVGYMANSVPAQASYGSDGSSTWEYLDSYGRVVGTQTRLTPDWSRMTAQRFFYNEAGHLDAETQPFIWGDPEYQVTYDRDILGRPLAAHRPLSEQLPTQDAATTFVYNRLTTSVSVPGNPANQTTVSVRDAIGRTVQVADSASGVSLYEYSAFDQLTKSTDPAGHFTTIAYNNRGDKTSLTDPDLGAWTYPEYTVFGELRKQVDAKSQTVLFKYDQLGRLDWRTEPEFPNGPGPDDDGKTDFTYYTTSDFKLGLPKDEIFPGGTAFRRTYVFDTLRRLQTETTTIDGTARSTDYAYHATGAATGKLQYITYPTSTSSVRVKLEQEYDGVGALWKVRDVTTGAFNGGVLYHLNYTDALLRETSATLGNGAIPTTRVYDRASFALKSIQTGSGNAVQNLQYDWYPNGNLEERSDLLRGKIENFTYDALGRLDTQSVNGGQLLDLAYSADGNLAFKNLVGTYSYGSRPHAVTGISGVQSNVYSYDPNGNMTNRDGDTITWFSHNRPKKINYGSSSSEFWYGADRNRYKHVAISGGSTVTMRYFGPHFEVETRGSLTIYRHYVFAGGQAVAQYERRSSGTPANDIQYLHRDHLASVVATTSAAGGIRQRWEYDAFGIRSRYAGSGADDTERGYTGHEHLDAVELTHMNGRVQDPELGRFISADPFVTAPYHSQSLNRYSYVWNNPLTLVDPSGFGPQGPGIPRPAPWVPDEGATERWLYMCLLGDLCSGVDFVGSPDTGGFVFGREGSGSGRGTTVNTPGVPQGGGSCGWNCLIAASSIPQHWYDSVLAQVNYVSGGLALWNVETFGGGPVVDRSSAAYQQGERSMAIAYTLATLGASVHEQVLQGAVGATNAARGATVTVGRWMSQVELKGMRATGRVQESFNSGVTSVTLPPNAGAYTAAPAGDVFVKFNVPRSAIGAADGVWGKIFGPNSIFGPARGIREMPPATNIVVP